MSKSYGLAGLRIGWIACSDRDVLSSISGNKHYLSICNSASSEILALIALRNSFDLVKRNKTIINRNLELVDQFMLKHSNIFEWSRPKGSCCGFVKVKLSDIEVDILADTLVNQFGILILPGSNFPCADHDEEYKRQISRYFRIGFGRLNFPLALEKFELAIRSTFPQKYF